MRHFWSITAVVAQVGFLLSPAWAQDMSPLCCQTARVAACHRTSGHSHGAAKARRASHHCTEMAKAEAPASAGEAVMAGHSHPCPMDCCVQGNPQSVNTVTAISVIPPPAVTAAELHFVPVIFLSAGFSSHTDRGPPQV
jgi:hypothetical protein